jgi:amino acid transporter/nucleotide-binding universal stress UspA family protein
MSKELERDLGLYATITISIGAMVGSGIFVLPGLAAGIAGPAVVLAYLLAGVIVIPAALAKSEMATAMPESGGTYLFIDRAMGPLTGTIAGLGAWFTLAFKSAFALVGLGAYLLLFVPIPSGLVKGVALILGVLLLIVNVIGVKQTGTLQAAIVSVVLIALGLFIATGLVTVDQTHYRPFFPQGAGGLLAATGFVFVSYAGVTKIASVAEEVENPGRNIPLGIMGSVLFMMFVYTFVVYVIVGVTPIDSISHSYKPMAVAAGEILGPIGTNVIAVIAVLALTSMANAGILSSSRYPLAMSRDMLFPPSLSGISDQFSTPIQSIVFTGAVLLLLIAFVPVVQLASAFQLLVFILIDIALIAFRESDAEWYEPEFTSPGYPWIQLFGFVGGIVVLTQMGSLALGGAVAIIIVGALWYYLYGRQRAEREGAAIDAIRRTTSSYTLDSMHTLSERNGTNVLVAVGPETTVERETTLLKIAGTITGQQNSAVEIVRFKQVPDQVPLASAVEQRTEAEETFEEQTTTVANELDVPVEISETVSHKTTHAVANHARENDADVVLGEWDPEFYHGELLDEDVDWYIRNIPSDLVFVRNRGLNDLNEIVVTTAQGPYDPLEVVVADAIAAETGATIRFLHAIDESASDEEIETVTAYHDRLTEICQASTTRELIRTDNRETALRSAVDSAELVIVSTAAHHLLYDVVFGSLPDRLANDLDSTVLLVHSQQPRRHTFIRYLLDRFVF